MTLGVLLSSVIVFLALAKSVTLVRCSLVQLPWMEMQRAVRVRCAWPASPVAVTLLYVPCHPSPPLLLVTGLRSQVLVKPTKNNFLPLNCWGNTYVGWPFVSFLAVALLIDRCPHFPHESEGCWHSVSLSEFTCPKKENGVRRGRFSLMLGLPFCPQSTLWKDRLFLRLTAGKRKTLPVK